VCSNLPPSGALPNDFWSILTLKLSSFCTCAFYNVTPQIALQIGVQFLDACGGENNGVAPLLFRCGATAPSSRCLCSKWSLSANLYRAYHISDSTAKRTLAAGRDFPAIILTRRCRISMRHTDGRTDGQCRLCAAVSNKLKQSSDWHSRLTSFYISSVKQSSALPSQQYRVTNKHKTYYAEQSFQLGNNWGYRHRGQKQWSATPNLPICGRGAWISLKVKYYAQSTNEPKILARPFCVSSPAAPVPQILGLIYLFTVGLLKCLKTGKRWF